MTGLIIVIAIALAIFLYFFATQRSLVALDEKRKNALARVTGKSPPAGSDTLPPADQPIPLPQQGKFSFQFPQKTACVRLHSILIAVTIGSDYQHK